MTKKSDEKAILQDSILAKAQQNADQAIVLGGTPVWDLAINFFKGIDDPQIAITRKKDNRNRQSALRRKRPTPANASA